MPDAPAVNGPSARTTPTKRPVTIAFAPCRAKKRSTPASRGSVIPRRPPCRSRNRRPRLRPSTYPQVSPATAAIHTIATRAGQLHLPAAGEHAAQDDGQLPRRDQADERARLEEGQTSDERVRPGTEPIPERLEQCLGRRHERSTAATPSLSKSSVREPPSSGVMSAPACSASSISASAGSRRGHPSPPPARAPDQR